MEVQTISAPINEARTKLAEYRAALKKQWTKTDEILVHTYRQLAKGRMLIDVRSAILSAGFDEHHRPKLAIARADQPHVWWRRSIYTRQGYVRGLQSSPRSGPFNERSTARDFLFHVPPTDAWPECGSKCPASHMRDARAMVPLIPPSFRPEGSHLSRCHVLWDAQGAWEAEPPTDPFLLRRVHGDLFAVLAVWDLTELERAVLRGIRAGDN
jgi:hypothetical protein